MLFFITIIYYLIFLQKDNYIFIFANMLVFCLRVLNVFFTFCIILSFTEIILKYLVFL